GIDVDHTEMLITTGGSEAITFAFLSTLNPGDEVIIPEPFYANYIGFAVSAGVVVKPITSSIEKDFALPAIEEFEKLITPKTKGIVICNPNNPTGYLYSESELQQLKSLIEKYDLYLYSDEVYREFCYDGNSHFSAMHLKGIEQNVIMLDSVSKRYSMCGVRIGALVTKNKDVINAAMKFAQARLCPPSFGQWASEAALNTPDDYFEEVYNEYIDRRNFMVDALNKMEGVYCPKPKGAFYTVVKLPIDDADKFAQWILVEFEYKKQTVMVAPATGFYATPGLGKNEVRIAYVLKKEDLANAMETLEAALKAYPGRTI
ncbi:MAG: pyridoxal phosphate-dependent aminotransferase, partial [Bacteroidales bacterium]|nr:pyridoxal phosphate-dependent aminotransferase [Bacteroidales bacterium]